MSKFDKYIGIEYKHLGRSFNGADCWGIVWLIFKEEKGVILPDNFVYEDDWYKKEDWNTNHMINGVASYKNKIAVNPPFKPFDVLLFYNTNRSFVDHMGMVVEENRFIHTYENRKSEISRFSGFWESRFWKGYRWQK